MGLCHNLCVTIVTVCHALPRTRSFIFPIKTNEWILLWCIVWLFCFHNKHINRAEFRHQLFIKILRTRKQRYFSIYNISIIPIKNITILLHIKKDKKKRLIWQLRSNCQPTNCQALLMNIFIIAALWSGVLSMAVC